MLWSDFVDAVDSHLAVEANRRGLEAFRARFMRNAVLDLQRYIRGYRAPFKTTYESTDLTAEGKAQLVEMPAGAIPKALWIYEEDVVDEDHSDKCCRHRLEFYPWNKRQDMICGALSFATWWGCCSSSGNCPPTPLTADELANWESKAYVWSMSPMARNLLIYPQVTAATRLLLVFESFLYDIDDADDVPFPEQASEAVAFYVLSRIAATIDKNAAMAAQWMQEYRAKRLELFRDFREVRDDLSQDPQEELYGATAVGP